MANSSDEIDEAKFRDDLADALSGSSGLPTSLGAFSELHNSTDRQAVIDGMSEGFALLNADFTIIDVNAVTMRHETRHRNEIVGSSVWKVYPGTEHSELGALYKKAMRERIALSIEHSHEWQDGSVQWLDMRAFPVGDTQLAIFFRDVTDRREARAALRESEERFRGAVAAFTDALWTNDAEGRMTGEQLGWAALTGQSFEEYQGYGWSKAVHPDDAQPTIDAWEKAVRGRQPFVFEHRLKVRNGEWRRYAIRAMPIANDDGSIREWVGVHRDITETTEARLQLARNAETFQALVRNNPFGIYVVDEAFRLLHVSQGCAKVFAGIAPLLGRKFDEILHITWPEEFANETIERFRRTLATGEPYVSHRTVEARGNIEAVEAYDWRIERIVLPDGGFGVVCYFYDLSERVELEESLRRALDDKEVLLREIDHRVRNSLSLVSALLTMQGNLAKTPEVKQSLKVAAARVQAVARIHERLYKSKQLGIVAFDAYLNQICDDLGASLASESGRILLEATPLEIAVDYAVPLGLVTNELVTNAFKHCEGSNVVIKVVLARDEESYTLTVSDDGIGMPATFVDGQGTGLGMQVVHLLVRQIGAEIDMPKAGQPAHFRVHIPNAIIAA